MTAKFPATKLLWEDIKHRSWLLILCLAGSMALLPFTLQLQLSSLEYGQGLALYQAEARWLLDDKLAEASRLLSGGNGLILLGCMLAAVVAAVTGFSYLQSARQVDFYHSLPIRREKLFALRYLGGFLMVVVPYLAAVAAALLAVCGAHGILCRDLAAEAAGAALFLILIFLLFYTTSILAMLLTGRLLTGILLTGFFCLYGVICTGVLHKMMSFYFQTYCSVPWREMPVWIISPFSLAVKAVDCLQSGEPLALWLWILPAALTGGLLALCLVMYRKRPSEAAGNAFSYRWMEPVLKTAAVIPCSLWVVVLVQVLGYTAGKGMMAAVVLLAAFILNGAFEFVFSQDLKNIWRHKFSGLLSLFGALVVLLAFQGDWFGYDSWQPGRDQVGSMAFYCRENEDIFMDGGWYFEDQEQKILEQGLTEDFDRIYQLAAEGIRQQETGEASGNMTSITVHYRMKSGLDAYRAYTVPAEKAQEALGQLTEDAALREKIYPVNFRSAENVTGIEIQDWNNLRGTTQGVSLNRQEIREFLEIFQKEYVSYSYQELKDMAPSGCLYLYCSRETPSRDSYEGSSIGYYLYPEFTETIAYLEKKGIRLQKEPDTSEIVSVQIDYLTDLEIPQSEDAAAAASSEVYVLNSPEAVRHLFELVVRARSAEYMICGEYADLQIMFSDGMYSSAPFKIRDARAFRAFLEEYALEMTM